MSASDETPGGQSPMRRVMANFWLLIRGRGAAALMSLGATTLMARALGPAEFGMVVLIQTYAMLVRGLFDFQPFEAVVRYGVPAHDAGDTPTVRRLITVCRRVDRRTSLTATALALVSAPLIGPSLGMDREHVILLAAYSLVLLSTGTGTASGILRLFDQFDTLGRQLAIAPILSFLGIVVAWWLDGPLAVFVAILAVAYVAENLYLIWHGRRQYRQHIGPPAEGEVVEDATLAEFSGLRPFLWINYWQSNLDVLPKHLATVLMSYLLGPAEAGLLRLARQFSSLLGKPAALVRQVVFLDLTRSWNQGSAAFQHVAYRTALIGGGIGLVFVVVGYFLGENLLVALVGEKFRAAAPVLTLMLLAATFDLASSSLRSAAYAIGHAGKVLRMYVVSVAVYLTLFVALTLWTGLIGAGLAACIAAAIPLVGMTLLIRTQGDARSP